MCENTSGAEIKTQNDNEVDDSNHPLVSREVAAAAKFFNIGIRVDGESDEPDPHGPIHFYSKAEKK